jgi:hypothetical protein
MKTVEKKNYIQSHLHQADEKLISEMYQKMFLKFGAEESIVGYDAAGNPIGKSQFIADIKKAEEQIERGDYITLEELEKESEAW